jgi:hypothetical protein
MPKKIAGYNLGSELSTIYLLELFVCSVGRPVRLRIERLTISSACRISGNTKRRPSGGRTEFAIYRDRR